jgi:hypothetical protein
MKREFESEAMQVLYEEWLDMYRSGFVSDARMREIDEICFGEDDETDPEVEDSPEEEEETE